jgi:hypothetical protein
VAMVVMMERNAFCNFVALTAFFLSLFVPPFFIALPRIQHPHQRWGFFVSPV